jgi:hypothetical protein
MAKKKENIEESIRDLPDAFKDKLTRSQAKAVGLLSDFFISDVNCFILKGYAGTGKTYLLKGIGEYLKSNSIPFFIMAPTGRAAQVASLKTGFRALTIHKSIYAIDNENEENLKKDFSDGRLKYYFEVRFNDVYGGVYIIDEASMISDTYSDAEMMRFGSGHLLQDLFKYVNLEDNKIIFIGDPAQLPPVNSDFSPALNRGYIENKYNIESLEYELTDVVRHEEGSGILENATFIRNKIIQNEFEDLKIDLTFGDIENINRNTLLKEYLNITNDEIDSQTIILAYANKTVQHYNNLIRSHFFPNNKTITEGDRVILVSNNYNYKIDLYNGDMGSVIKADENLEFRDVTFPKGGELRTVRLCFRDMVIRFWDLEGNPNDISCKIYEPLLYSPNRDISSDEASALYYDYRTRDPHFQTEDMFSQFSSIRVDPYYNCLRVKYGYAVTCHKAQGGEWDNVFIDMKTYWDYHNQSYFRWLYTALTRAKKQAFILNPPGGINIIQSPQNYDILQENEIHQNIKPIIENVETEYHSVTPKQEIIQSVRTNPFNFPDKQPWLSILYHKISDIIQPNQYRIEKILHQPFCERYFFEGNTINIWVNFWYNKGKRISLIDSDPSINMELKIELLDNLNILQGFILEEIEDKLD